MKTILTTALAAGLCLAGGAASADDKCFYKGSMFSDGGVSCQQGVIYNCDDGEWEPTAQACPPDFKVVRSSPCDLAGISYATGSNSCQEGQQYRCENGSWRNLGLNCGMGDAPIKVVPSGKTCMFDDATVAHNSTICRSGSTFLCSDGAWVNLGTQCR
jgi:hypothetical protein